MALIDVGDVEERLLASTPATISATWFEDGAAADPGTVTIDIDREDGTNLVIDGVALGTGATPRTFDLSAADTALLDVLRVTWTSTTKGTITTRVEIVGGFLFSLSDLSAALPVGANPSVPNQLEGRERAETQLEDLSRVAFRPRYARDLLDGGDTELLLSHPRPLTVRSVKVDGVALTAGELADLELYDTGILFRSVGWPTGRRNVEVVYEHGFRQTPPPVSRAAIKLARFFLLSDPANLDERATRIDTEDASYSLVLAGVRGAPTSIPEVNAVITQYGYIVG